MDKCAGVVIMSGDLAMDRSLVRPRFTDGTFDAPLLLEEHFEETILSGSRRHIFIEGARGSGLTTALALLAQIARRHGFSPLRSEEHTSELQSRENLVCRLLLEKKKKKKIHHLIHKKKNTNTK